LIVPASGPGGGLLTAVSQSSGWWFVASVLLGLAGNGFYPTRIRVSDASTRHCGSLAQRLSLLA